MQPKIVETKSKKIIGMKKRMSLAEDKTSELWKGFIAQHKEIRNRSDQGFYSIQVYDKDFKIESFNETVKFDKWAAVEVTNLEHIPEGMETHLLSGGKFAVFIHKGKAETFYKTAQYIYTVWLPDSGYQLDDREHYEYMGELYLGPENPDSEEEVWIPIK